MKQSTKLLSLVLAIVMAFSCMSVIGSAADTVSSSTQVTYDSIDDAITKKNKLFLYKISIAIKCRYMYNHHINTF